MFSIGRKALSTNNREAHEPCEDDKKQALEEDGLIVRRVYSEIPPKVEYELSEIGHKFEKVLAELEVWGNEYIDFMHQRQANKPIEK